LANKTRVSGRSGKKKLSEEEEEWEALSLHKEEAEKSLIVLSQLMSDASALDAAARDLRDHANGFYEEIDKLAKGKSLLEVTDRALEETTPSFRTQNASWVTIHTSSGLTNLSPPEIILFIQMLCLLCAL
jgi:hypothetical protein